VSAPSRSTSLFRTLCETPLRDLLRGSLSGRLDTRRPIERAELPLELAAIVRKVVGDLRLMRAERADVARELAAHFADGLEAGATPNELAQSFGDPEMSAKLITSARKRARPMHVKIAIRTAQGLGVLVALLLVLYLFELARFHMGDPTISRNYLAEHNERIEQIPEEERAWPVYRKAILALHPLTDEQRDAIDWRPVEAKLAAAVEIIAEKQEALALFREAAQRRVMGFPWSDFRDDPQLAPIVHGADFDPEAGGDEPLMLFEVLLPHLGDIRTAAHLFAADVHLAEREADADRALADLSAIIGMATHVRTEETLIEALVDLSMFAIASGVTSEILHEHPELFSEDELTMLAHRFAGTDFDPIPPLETERKFFLDVIQRSFTDDGSGDGLLVDEGFEVLERFGSADEARLAPALAGPIARHLVGSRAEQIDLYDRAMTYYKARAAMPLWEHFKDRERAADKVLEEGIRDVYYMFVRMALPALDRMITLHKLGEVERDRALVAIALEFHRRREGRYPDALADLVPRYLSEVPLDRFDGAPLRYRVVDGEPRVWSVGSDLDDDGGVPARDGRGVLHSHRRPEDIDGDWILYPPDWLLYPDAGEND